MLKKTKPFGIVRTHGEKYYLLEPHARRMSDGTFEFLVVPFVARAFQADDISRGDDNSAFVPRFVRTNEFASEHMLIDEIYIKTAELEE